MSIGAHLCHRCTIRRVTATQPDPFGNDTNTWSDWGVDVPCRLVVKGQRAVDTEKAQDVTVTTYKLLLPAGTDVVEGDRVTDLEYEDGSEESGTFSVEAILPRRGRTVKHIALELRKVS